MRPKKKFWQRQVFWFALFFLLMACAGAYFILFLPDIQVENIQVSGNHTIHAEAIEGIAKKSIRKNLFPAGLITITSESMVVVNTAELEQLIAEAFPSIKEVRVRKKWPRGIIIEIVEREAVALFCEETDGSVCFHMDEEGVIFQEAQPDGSLPVIRKAKDAPAQEGNRAVQTQTMGAIITIANLLKEQFQVAITEVLVSNPIVISASEGWKLYLDPDEPAAAQAAKLQTLLASQIPPQARKQLQYIYLQYKDRAYYK